MMKILCRLIPLFILAHIYCRAQAPGRVGGTVLHLSVLSAGLNTPNEQVDRWLETDTTYTDIRVLFTDRRSGVVTAGKPETGTYSYTSSGAGAQFTFSPDDPLLFPVFRVLPVIFVTPTSGQLSIDAGVYYPSTFTLRTAAVPNGPINISNRSYVNSGNPGITGFILAGSEKRFVLIRAIGPGLVPFQVGNPLKDPYIEVHTGNATAERLVGWRTAVESGDFSGYYAHIFSLVNAFSLDPTGTDTVFVTELDPGAHTVVMGSAAGKNEGTALTEVYFLP